MRADAVWSALWRTGYGAHTAPDFRDGAARSEVYLFQSFTRDRERTMGFPQRAHIRAVKTGWFLRPSLRARPHCPSLPRLTDRPGGPPIISRFGFLSVKKLES